MNRKIYCTILSILIATTICAQPVKRYEGKMKPHASLTKLSTLLNSEHIGNGYYDYYEMDGRRVLHGDYSYESENKLQINYSVVAKGKFVNGEPEGEWIIFEYHPYYGSKGNSMKFTCQQGKLYGHISLFYKDVPYQTRFDAVIYNDILVGDFSHYTEKSWGDTNKTLYLKGRFDDMGWATGNWITYGENHDLPQTYTISFPHADC